MSTTAATETVRIEMPAEILAIYERQAKSRNIPVEWVMAERLRHYSAVPSQKPLVIDDESRRELESMLSRNFSSPDALVSSVSRIMTVRLDGLEIQLKPPLLDRLKYRCIGMEWHKFIKQTITQCLESFAGMR